MLTFQNVIGALIGCVLVVFCSWVLGEDAQAELAALKVEIPVQHCTKPDPGSRRRVDWIRKLDGRRIVFVGDSPLRFQYLGLGYYLAHGSCPDAGETGRKRDILAEESFGSWPEFFQHTSEALTVRSKAFHTAEDCMCFREGKEPKQVTEQRTFTYQDAQGRRVELVYLMYLREEYQPLSAVLQTADSYRPTDVVVSFGEELKHTSPQCGMSPDNTGTCPYLPWFCWYLRAEHPFQLWWLPALPTAVDNGLHDDWYTSHLNLYHRCMLEFPQVIDRRAAITTLQPDAALQHHLWHSSVHLNADAVHAFNWQLVRRIPGPSNVTIASSRKMSHTWKLIFSSQSS